MNNRIFIPMKAMGRDLFVDCATELEDAKSGRITPQEAEEQAEKKGFFLSLPFKDFQLDDPAMCVWTLEMTAAWISWRDRARLLRHFELSYKVARGWIPNREVFPPPKGPVFGTPKNGRFGNELKSFGPTNIRDRFFEFNGREGCLDWDTKCWTTLHKELVTGRIRASGQLCIDEWVDQKQLLADSDRVQQARLKMMIDGATERSDHGGGIPRAFWRDLKFDVVDQKSVVRYQGAVLYTDIKFDAEEVLGRFPADRLSADEYGRVQLLWLYREPPVKVRGDMSIAVAAWIRSEHRDGFPRTKRDFDIVRDIIEKKDVDNHWGFLEKSDNSYRKFVQRLLDQLLEEPYSKSRRKET